MITSIGGRVASASTLRFHDDSVAPAGGPAWRRRRTHHHRRARWHHHSRGGSTHHRGGTTHDGGAAPPPPRRPHRLPRRLPRRPRRRATDHRGGATHDRGADKGGIPAVGTDGGRTARRCHGHGVGRLHSWEWNDCGLPAGENHTAHLTLTYGDSSVHIQAPLVNGAWSGSLDRPSSWPCGRDLVGGGVGRRRSRGVRRGTSAIELSPATSTADLQRVRGTRPGHPVVVPTVHHAGDRLRHPTLAQRLGVDDDHRRGLDLADLHGHRSDEQRHPLLPHRRGRPGRPECLQHHGVGPAVGGADSSRAP